MPDDRLSGEAWDRSAAEGYLDTASIGLTPRDLKDAAAACVDALSRGTRGFHACRTEMERVRALVADEFGGKAQEVEFFSSTGEALNTVAQAIPVPPDRIVLLQRDDFPTVVQPWSHLGPQRTLLDIGPEEDRNDAFLAELSSSTHVVSVSHVHPNTGQVVDLDRLGRACREAGAVLVVDGAQSAGCIPLSLRHVDFFVATGYKWLLAGFGIAVLIGAAPDGVPMSPRLRGHANPFPEPRLPYASPNVAGVYALGAAADRRREIGIDAIHAHVARLVNSLQDKLTERGLVCYPARGQAAGIVSVEVPRADEVAEALATCGHQVAVRDGRLRFSPHLYTSELDVTSAVTSLDQILEGSARPPVPSTHQGAT